MASGPRAGLAEIHLPEVLPPSATMPGNVNPVLIEMLLQACARILGNDVTVAFAGSAGQFELNAMMPVMGFTCLESMDILSLTVQRFGDKCIRNMTADAKRCMDYVDKNLSLIAALTPRIGADLAAKLVREALNTGRNLREIVLEKNILSADKLNDLFNLDKMTEPG